MWCEKCHSGNYGIIWKLDEDGHFRCLQCQTLGAPLIKCPFEKAKSSKAKASKGKKSSKKFLFDQKGGADSNNPDAKKQSEQVVRGTEVDKPVEDKVVEDKAVEKS